MSIIFLVWPSMYVLHFTQFDVILSVIFFSFSQRLASDTHHYSARMVSIIRQTFINVLFVWLVINVIHSSLFWMHGHQSTWCMYIVVPVWSASTIPKIGNNEPLWLMSSNKCLAILYRNASLQCNVTKRNMTIISSIVATQAFSTTLYVVFKIPFIPWHNHAS